MPEYIEREALIARLKKVCVTDDVFEMGMQVGVEHAINCTKEAPTADVVEVVRCKDCKYRYVPCHCALWYATRNGTEYFIERGEEFFLQPWRKKRWLNA